MGQQFLFFDLWRLHVKPTPFTTLFGGEGVAVSPLPHPFLGAGLGEPAPGGWAGSGLAGRRRLVLSRPICSLPAAMSFRSAVLCSHLLHPHVRHASVPVCIFFVAALLFPPFFTIIAIAHCMVTQRAPPSFFAHGVRVTLPPDPCFYSGRGDAVLGVGWGLVRRLAVFSAFCSRDSPSNLWGPGRGCKPCLMIFFFGRIAWGRWVPSRAGLVEFSFWWGFWGAVVSFFFFLFLAPHLFPFVTFPGLVLGGF